MADTVLGYGAPPLPFGSLDYPTPFAFPLYVGVDPFNLGSHEGLAYLLAAAPFNPALVSTMASPPIPFGDIDRAGTSWLGASPTIYPAATIGRASSPSDVPANTYVPAKLKSGLNYGVSILGNADPTSRGSATVGVIELVDPDGELDGLTSLGWDGAPLRLYRGDPAAPFSAWSLVATLTAGGMLYGQRNKEIQLRDLSWLLNTAPLHGLRYLGTGGIEGDASLTGRVKPYAVGAFQGASPVLINAGLLVYQVSCSAVASIVAKQGGLAMTLDGDDSTYAALAAATIAVGHYRTCKALGIFRLGGAPALAVTVDGIGDSDVINGLSTPMTRAQIARRIATGRGSYRLDDSTQIDVTAYVALENSQTASVGFYWNDEITKGEALSEVMAGCLGYWFTRLNGSLSLGQLFDPSTATPYVTLAFPADGAGERRLGEPQMVDFKPPVAGTYVGYSRNYTVFTVEQIAGAVPLSESAILQADSQYAAALDVTIANGYPTAPTVHIAGNFATLADARVEAERQQALRRTRRELWSIPAAIDPLADIVGRVVAIQNFNRYGFGASRNFLCVGIDATGGPFVNLKLWG
jgi:hypothetical protein